MSDEKKNGNAENLSITGKFMSGDSVAKTTEAVEIHSGERAKPIFLALMPESEAYEDDNKYRVEIRDAQNHTKLSVGTESYSANVSIFKDGSLEIVKTNIGNKTAEKTVYDTDGTIEIFEACWNQKSEEKYKNLYHRIGISGGQQGAVHSEWQKFKTLLENLKANAPEQTLGLGS